MAEQQRIYPVDLESAVSPKPTAPLVSGDAARSDEPPYGPSRQTRRTIPAVSPLPPPNKRYKRNRCCRCICCSLLAILVLIIAVAAAAGILYLIFRPKLPKYSVDSLAVSAFSVDAATLAARASFALTVTAYNPNKRIGIYYEDGSRLNVLYGDTSLCSGSFPVFYQGHRNRTTVKVALDGEATLGSQVSEALQREQATGRVPLRFNGDVPVKVKLGKLKLWKVTARVRCDIVVNSLTAGSLISLKTSDCKFRLKL